MATIYANETFDFDTFDFNALRQSATDTQFFNNDPITFHGVTYNDSFGVEYTSLTGPAIVGFLGDRLTFSQAQGTLTGGNVLGIVGFNAVNTTESWGIQGVRLSVVDLNNAAGTISTADDIAIFSAAFAGADSFTLSNQGDLARGFAGQDSMLGRGGKDTLFGGEDNDTLNGGTGADSLYGGAGRDRLIAGNDAATDTFHFNTIAESGVGTAHDAIAQFVRADDLIDLRLIDANKTVGGNQAFAFSAGHADFAVWAVDTGTDLLVRADVTGDGVADFEISLGNVAALTAANFLL